jgi:hypothetical protein
MVVLGLFLRHTRIMNYITTLTCGSGIGSAVIGIVNALAYMKVNGINDKLYINITQASAPCKVLFTHFLDLSKIPITLVDIPHQVIFNKELNNHQLITPGNYTELWYTPKSQSNFDFQLKCDMFELFWKLKDSFNPDTYDVCINIRRGDKVTLEPHLNQGTVREFIAAVDSLDNVKTIFHTSDDYSTFLEFKKERPSWEILTMCTPQDVGYFLKDLNQNKNQNSIVNHVAKFIKELQVMKSSNWFVGTRTTNVGLVVELMRRQKNVIFIY